MKAILIIILSTGVIKTKPLPNLAVCEKVKVEVLKANVKNLSKVICEKK